MHSWGLLSGWSALQHANSYGGNAEVIRLQRNWPDIDTALLHHAGAA